MNRMTMKKQRRVLRGWIKWVPVVAIPFSILFFHAWLNIQILRADYVLRELDAEAREWSDRLNHTGMAETIHEDPNMLADQAAQMAFVQPSPGQREIIYYDPSIPLVDPEDANFEVAQLDGAPQPDPAATESLVDQAYVPAAPAMPATPELAVATVEAAVPAEAPLVATDGFAEIVPVDAATETAALPMEAPLVATDGFAEVIPMTSTPVALQLDTTSAQPRVEPTASTPDTVETLPASADPAVVLEASGGAHQEDVVDLEVEMESLESL